MAGDRTEKPTAKRLRDARKKGQTARSGDLAHVASLAGAVIALASLGSAAMASLAWMVAYQLGDVGRLAVAEIGHGDLQRLAFDGIGWVARTSGPVAAAAALGAIAVNVAQSGWIFAPAALRVDLSRLSPAKGLQRLGFSGAGLMSVKVFLALGAVGTVAGLEVWNALRVAQGLGTISAVAAGEMSWASIDRLLKRSLLALALVAAVDYGLQRWRFTRSLRMSKQEVRDDYKLSEGNPEIKGRVRRVQREMARRRMLSAVEHATIVVTNPTEYAVALEYRRSEMAAPRVVAKGRNLLAVRIKAIAREHGVPTVENVPLAQALYRTAEVGGVIPADLFEAVAEVLAYLIRAKQLTL